MKIPIVMFLLAFTYYALLSSKTFTWIFVSGDSGDWLAASNWWFVPQPLGSPLFVLLGKFLALFPGDQVVKMTLLLSSLPSAVTVALVYMVVRRLTASTALAAVSATVLLGASIFLTQSTVLEQYALATMFPVLAFWFYIHGWRKLTLVAMGLGTAVHIMVLPIAVIWLVVERGQWKEWMRISWVYVLTGVMPYLMVPILMALHAPPLLAGYFGWDNLESLQRYMFGVSGVIVGQMSVVDFPKRMGLLVGHLVMSMGLALVPIGVSVWTRMRMGEMTKPMWICLATSGFAVWYYTLNLDPSTWTFMTFGMPFMAIMAGVGLKGMGERVDARKYALVVACGALVLVMANGVFLNANTVNDKNRLAMGIKETLESLPEDSAVITAQGSYSLALMWVMSEGREDIMPLIWVDLEVGKEPSQPYLDYCSWIEERYGVGVREPREMVVRALGQGRDVYIIGEPWMMDDTRGEGVGKLMWKQFMQEEIEMEGVGSEERVRRVTGMVLMGERESDRWTLGRDN